VSFVTTTHVEWTDSACALFNLYANTSASCQPNDVVTVLATATALFSVFLLATDQHFPVPICVMLSSAYWGSVLWIAWGVSLVVGVTLAMAGVVCRNAVLLFPETRAVSCVCRDCAALFVRVCLKHPSLISHLCSSRMTGLLLRWTLTRRGQQNEVPRFVPNECVIRFNSVRSNCRIVVHTVLHAHLLFTITHRHRLRRS